MSVTNNLRMRNWAHPILNSRFFSLIFLAMVFLSFWWFLALSRFSPTDDGFVLAQSWRILNGEIPHLDFTTPRPAGSALLHLPAMFFPFGTFAVSRLIVSFQLVVIAWLSVDLLMKGTRPWAKIPYFLVVFALNVGVFPIMAWHTIDGIFLAVVSMWLIQRARPTTALYSMAWALSGFAVLVKQGFIVVPILVAILAAGMKRWNALNWAWVALVPILFYALWTWQTPNGVGSQLSSGSIREYFLPLLLMLENAVTWPGWISLGFLLASVGMSVFFGEKRPMWRELSGAVATLPILIMAITSSFSLTGGHSLSAYLAFLLASVLVFRDRGPWLTYLCFAILAYGVSMSWGVPSPYLLTGTLSLGVFLAIAKQSPEGPSAKVARFSAVWFLAFVSIFSLSWSSLNYGYRERVQEVPMSTTHVPGFALIRMNDSTAAYLQQVDRCIRQYRPDTMAVWPDGAAMYPGFRIRNPLALDWPLLGERSGDFSQRINANISEINSSTASSLVMIQSFPLDALPTLRVEDVASPGPSFHYSGEDELLLEQFNGEFVRCGSLAGWWKKVETG
jgi:hypothetical protein